MMKDLNIVELNALYNSANKLYEYYARMTEDPSAFQETYYQSYFDKRSKLYRQLSLIRDEIEGRINVLVEGDE